MIDLTLSLSFLKVGLHGNGGCVAIEFAQIWRLLGIMIDFNTILPILN
jgi:hypothetical protein